MNTRPPLKSVAFPLGQRGGKEPSRPTERAQILIVDDEANIRATTQMALDAAGYHTEGVVDGTEALAKFGMGSEWDLVLLDERMPGIDGLEVLRQIRERDPAARVVIVSAYASIQLAVAAMKSGAMDFLRKPFTPEVLRGAVKAALARPRQRILTEELKLARLLTTPPKIRPLIYFHTLNGYEFWSMPLRPDQKESEALRVLRAFEVAAPSGETRRCLVELATSVRGAVWETTRREYPPTDALWDTVCRCVLADYLWQEARMPPETLCSYELSIEQMDVVRHLTDTDLCCILRTTI